MFWNINRKKFFQKRFTWLTHRFEKVNICIIFYGSDNLSALHKRNDIAVTGLTFSVFRCETGWRTCRTSCCLTGVAPLRQILRHRLTGCWWSSSHPSRLTRTWSAHLRDSSPSSLLKVKKSYSRFCFEFSNYSIPSPKYIEIQGKISQMI